MVDARLHSWLAVGASNPELIVIISAAETITPPIISNGFAIGITKSRLVTRPGRRARNCRHGQSSAPAKLTPPGLPSISPLPDTLPQFRYPRWLSPNSSAGTGTGTHRLFRYFYFLPDANVYEDAVRTALDPGD